MYSVGGDVAQRQSGRFISARPLVRTQSSPPIFVPGRLASLLQEPKDGLHSIRIDDIPYVLYLDPKQSDIDDKTLLRKGLSALQRLP